MAASAWATFFSSSRFALACASRASASARFSSRVLNSLTLPPPPPAAASGRESVSFSPEVSADRALTAFVFSR